jgi:hypothetical protein
MVSAEGDLTTLKDCINAVPGSIAFLPGFETIWQKDFEGNWIEIEGGGGGSSVVIDKNLSVEGAAADAKAVGDRLGDVDLEVSSDGEGDVSVTLMK